MEDTFYPTKILKNMTQLLVFTDLDGTLLDHHTYSFHPALSTFQALQTFTIPCILNTSKTFAELNDLRQSLRHKDPFIVENGAAVYIPKELGLINNGDQDKHGLEDHGHYWLKAFGPHRQTLIDITTPLSSRFQFKRFSDMTWQDVAELTGLTEQSAKLAMQREFTEPMVWKDSANALNLFRDALKDTDIQVQKGGRFTHLMGKSCDKARAMLWLSEQYAVFYQSSVTSMALGDGENDIGMLSKADIPVVVRSPVHAPPEIPGRYDAWLTDAYGPEGWAQAVNKALASRGIV